MRLINSFHKIWLLKSSEFSLVSISNFKRGIGGIRGILTNNKVKRGLPKIKNTQQNGLSVFELILSNFVLVRP
jgi:hypothetical protein